jgi:hypothetical protein
MMINLVRVGDKLVGRTFSDRWNLAQLGFTHLSYSRNQMDIKRLRRANPDFMFATANGPMLAITDVERGAFNRPARKAA